MNKITFNRQRELSPATPVDLGRTTTPRYGRFLDEFEPGITLNHPRGLTIPAAFALEFAGAFMQANPLYLNREYAISCGFTDLLVSPLLVLNVALSLGVQNNSEQAIAHLGYYDVQFWRPVYAGDTLRSQSLVLSRRWRGSQPGIVRVRTTAFNQHEQAVLQYERAILIPTQSPSAHTHTDETEGYHTQPTVSGDTLYAISRVLATADEPRGTPAGIVTLQLIGVKNITGKQALQMHGAALFAKENDKSHTDRIPAKVFEIERRLLIRKS